ncbi:MAG TPA: BatA domain-containing protein, partial [Steroidobacteraceae bacterium]|nr:BatA domain-containing protein [Steroidobacteraceae bacterium]
MLGALAVAAPVIFHLIRRTTRERTVFSSLMFLLPTPPRLTKRSRLEDLLLLLLRCLALGLLALGFARPFLRRTAPHDAAAGEAKRIALVVDVSASMRRAGL